jgi:hypothetical protein
VTEK